MMLPRKRHRATVHVLGVSSRLVGRCGLSLRDCNDDEIRKKRLAGCVQTRGRRPANCSTNFFNGLPKLISLIQHRLVTVTWHHGVATADILGVTSGFNVRLTHFSIHCGQLSQIFAGADCEIPLLPTVVRTAVFSLPFSCVCFDKLSVVLKQRSLVLAVKS